MDVESTFGLPPGSILAVTGGRDAGKTGFCCELAGRWQAAGLKAAGIISLGRFENGRKTGFYALDVRRGESRLLASRVEGELQGLRFDPWVFDPRVMEWGNAVLSASVDTDLLVIDELGPLEFRLSKGWTTAFGLLKRKKFRLAAVVVRPECLDDFSKMGFAFETMEIKPAPRQSSEKL